MKESGGRWPYVTVQRLAKGGMGQVELVVRRDGDFARLYAVKRLLPLLADDESMRGLFLEEARIAGLLRHPNVVSVLDCGEDDEGPFLVMDYVEGISAAQLIRVLSRNGERLPIQLALAIMIDACNGLHAAHVAEDHQGEKLHLIHRDISPQNILIGFDGTARLTDFGIAKALGRGTRTTTGILRGKMGYMAPERLRFEHADHRSDLFSVGVVLYELLAGARAYSASSDIDVARAVLNGAPPDIGLIREDVPDRVTELLFELMAKDPAERPASAKEVGDRLSEERMELALEQGSHDLGAFMSERLGAVQRRVREQVRLSLEEAKRSPKRSTPSPDGASPRRRWVAGAVLLLVASAFAIGYLVAAPDASAPAAIDEPRAEPADSAEDREPATVAMVPEPDDAPPSTEEHEPAAQSTTTMEEAETRPAPSRPARRRPRMRRGSGAEMRSAPIWMTY